MADEILDIAAINSLCRDELNQRLTDKKQELFFMSNSNINFAALQIEVFNMLKLQRQNNWDISMNDVVLDQNDFIDPKAYDVLLSDVNHGLLMGEISDILAVPYLSPAKVPMESWRLDTLTGILYGLNSRPMINLVVSSKVFKKDINVIFLVDTGSPHMYLCEKAMEKLGFNDQIPPSFEILFRGMVFPASVSPKVMPDGRVGQFQDVNLIGSSFLTKSRALLLADYEKNEMSITFR